MNLSSRIMSFDMKKSKQENCNCTECTSIVQKTELKNQNNDYLKSSEKEIEQIISERYSDKDEKTKVFIKKALGKHGDRYDYSKTIYVKALEKVEIICRVKGHSSFWQQPSKHLICNGCPKCVKECMNKYLRLTLEKFIEKAKKLHGDKYDYSKVNYVNYETEVCIICKNHKEPFEFMQKPTVHLRGCGCPKCAIKENTERQKMNLDEFIKRANKIHGIGRYDYSKVKYINARTRVCIVCNRHEQPFEFFQMTDWHLRGNGCSKCNKNNKLTTKEFIERANKIHGIGRYDYSKVKYINAHTKVCIKCNKHKESFEFWQTADSHLNGCGCPRCNSSKGEILIRKYLINNLIKFEEQKRFNGCRNKSLLPFDFYLPYYNLCIEFDGMQHFIPFSFTSKVTEEEKLKNFKQLQLRDQIKTNFCKVNNINLLRIRYDENIEKKLTKYFQKHEIIELTIFDLV